MTGNDDRSDESEAACQYCDRRFPTAEILSLHLGRRHESRLTERERARFEDAKAAEADQLRLLQLQALAGLVLLYFGLLFAYAIFA